MAGKKMGENSRKVAGNAQKAAAAQAKADAENAKKSQAEAAEWSKGAKSTDKKYDITYLHPSPPPPSPLAHLPLLSMPQKSSSSWKERGELAPHR